MEIEETEKYFFGGVFFLVAKIWAKKKPLKKFISPQGLSRLLKKIFFSLKNKKKLIFY
jgi:hypothetical protein